MLELLHPYIDPVVHLEVVDGLHLLPPFGLYRMVAGDYHPDIVFILIKCLRQAANDIRQSPCLHEWHAFRGCEQNLLHRKTLLFSGNYISLSSDFADNAIFVRLDFIHRLHGFNHTNDISCMNVVAFFNIWRVIWRLSPIECAYKR